MMKLANNIKYFRRQNGWSQDELSEFLNISRSAISKWENGSERPDVETLGKLSHIFKVSIDHLIGNSVFKEDILREVNRIYRIKDEQASERMLDVIDYVRQNAEMERIMYALSQLPQNKRKNIEHVLITAVDAFLANN